MIAINSTTNNKYGTQAKTKFLVEYIIPSNSSTFTGLSPSLLFISQVEFLGNKILFLAVIAATPNVKIGVKIDINSGPNNAAHKMATIA